MILLGLALTLAYVPGWSGAHIQTGWAVLSLVLPWTLWRGAPCSPLHLFGAAFLAFALLSLAWTPILSDGIMILWELTLLALAFRWAPTDLRGLYRGLALGLSVSSVIAILQHFRIEPVLQLTIERSSGLLFSPTILGYACALVLIALATERMWLWCLGILPALILSQARGAWLILGVVLGVWLLRVAPTYLRITVPVLLAASVLATFAVLGFQPDPARTAIWTATLRDLSLLGHGAGSLANILLFISGSLTHPVFAHNEPLDLVYQFGVAGLIPVWIAAVLLGDQIDAPEWPLFLGFCVLALFFGPLQHPLLGFLGAVSAGRLARSFALARRERDRSGPPRSLVPAPDPSRFNPVPVQLGTPR